MQDPKKMAAYTYAMGEYSARQQLKLMSHDAEVAHVGSRPRKPWAVEAWDAQLGPTAGAHSRLLASWCDVLWQVRANQEASTEVQRLEDEKRRLENMANKLQVRRGSACLAKTPGASGPGVAGPDLARHFDACSRQCVRRRGDSGWAVWHQAR